MNQQNLLQQQQQQRQQQQQPRQAVDLSDWSMHDDGIFSMGQLPKNKKTNKFQKYEVISFIFKY
jgi:hypothetical protein